MVVESLINPLKAENHPAKLIMLGFIYTLIACFLSNLVFANSPSLVMVFLIVLASVPLVIGVIQTEEKKDVSDFHEIALLKEHSKALSAFLYLFIGVTLCVALCYSVLPAENVSVLFSQQIDTIKNMGHSVTGLATGTLNSSISRFTTIFYNNMHVLIYCILFSFLYGAGAIFILIWNATVIGTAMGNFVRSNIVSLGSFMGFTSMTQYFSIVSIGIFKYVVHGIPEILAYFVAGLAGGIISIAVIKHDFVGKKFEHVVLDAADLLLISIGLVFIAALLEVFITPLIFA